MGGSKGALKLPFPSALATFAIKFYIKIQLVIRGCGAYQMPCHISVIIIQRFASGTSFLISFYQPFEDKDQDNDDHGYDANYDKTHILTPLREITAIISSLLRLVKYFWT